MSAYLGTTPLANLRLGTSEIDKVYLGTSLVWERTADIIALFEDNFNRSNGDVGTGYAAVAGSSGTTIIELPIDGNKLVAPTQNANYGMMRSGSFGPNQWASASFSLGSDYSEAGLFLQAHDGEFQYQFMITTDGTHPSFPTFGTVDGPAAQMYKAEGGGATYEMLNNVGVSITGTHRIYVSQIGRALQFWYDGVRIMTGTDPDTTIGLDGQPGLTAHKGNASGPVPSMDDFSCGGWATAPAAPTLTTLTPDEGNEGTIVNATGTGFVKFATMVTIDGVNYPVTVTSSTEGTFTAPAGEGVESVTLTTPGGTSSAVDFDFVVEKPYLGAITETVQSSPASHTTLSCAAPSDVVEDGGTLMTIFTISTSGGDMAMAAPAGKGFAPIGPADVDDVVVGTVGVYIHSRSFWSTDDLSEETTLSPTWSSSVLISRVIIASINHTSGTPTAPSYSSRAGTGTFAWPAVTTTDDHSMVFSIAIFDPGATVSTPTGFALATSISGTDQNVALEWFRDQTTAGASPTPTVTGSGTSVGFFAVSIGFSPVPAFTPDGPTEDVMKGAAIVWRIPETDADIDLLNVSWWYDWGNYTYAEIPDPGPGGIPFGDAPGYVPMCWGDWEDSSKWYFGTGPAATQEIHPAGTLLGFNEPDVSSQSNVTVARALELWPQMEATGARLGSPATSGGGLSWFTSFMAGSGGYVPHVDFICMHWYGDYDGDVTAFAARLDYLWTTYGKPIWITECGNLSAGVAANEAMMDDVIAMVAARPFVERISWFANRDSGWPGAYLINEDGTLNAAGITYAAIPPIFEHEEADTVPAQVTGLTATPGDGQVVLAWSVPSDGGSALSGYTINYRNTGDSSWTFVDFVSSGTTYTHTGRTNGTSLDYQVAAVNANGNGTYSSTATATPTAATEVTLPDTFDRPALGAEYITNSSLTDWQLVDSTARAVATFEGDWLLWADPIGADVEVSGSFDVDGTVNQGASNLIARSSSTVSDQNGIVAQLLGGNWSIPADHLWLRLLTVTTNEETVLGTYDLGVQTAPFTTEKITLRCAGDQLSVLYDDVVVIGPITEDLYQTNTYCGFRIYDGDHAGQHRLREFDAQPYSDISFYEYNFNAADGALPAPWVTVGGSAAPQISGNRAVPGSGDSAARIDQTFSPNQWAECDVDNPASSGIFGASVRMGATFDDPVYYTWYSAGDVQLWKRTGPGAYTQLGSHTAALGYRVRIEAEGTEVRVFVDDVEVITVTDSSIATGQPGLMGGNYGQVSYADNFRCGDLPYISPFVGFRTFDGTDGIFLDIAESAAETLDAMTWVAVVRQIGSSPSTYGSGTYLAAGNASHSPTVSAYWYDIMGRMEMDWVAGGYTSTSDSGVADSPALGWVIVAITKAAGSNQPFQAYRYQFSADDWNTAASTGTVNPAVAPGAGGNWVIGNQNDVLEGYYGDIAAEAVWDVQLTQTEVETLTTLDAWLNLAPKHVWRLDMDTIVDLVGTANQTSVSGTPAIDTDERSPFRVS